MTLMTLEQEFQIKSGEPEERFQRFIKAMREAFKHAIDEQKCFRLPGLGAFSPGQASDAANISKHIAALLHEPDDSKVNSMLKAYSSIVLSRLLNAEAVDIPDIGRLKIYFYTPYIEKTPFGHRIVKQGYARIEYLPAVPSLKFTVDENLEKRIQGFSETKVLFVVPEKDFFSEVLEYYFKNAGWKVEMAFSSSDALKILESGSYLSIIDSTCRGSQEIVKQLKFNPATSMLPLILMFPDEDSFNKPRDVLIIGDDNLWQPFEIKHLLDVADSEVIRATEQKRIYRQQVRLILPSTDEAREKCGDLVEEILKKSGLSEDSITDFAAGVREAVLNAAQHGNKFKEDLKIEVHYQMDNDKITIAVKDEGEGFDYDFYINLARGKDSVELAKRKAETGRFGGLGIKLMLRCCDRLEYDNNGSLVRLYRYIRKNEGN